MCLVANRTIMLIALATFVWAASTSSLAGYFYLQNLRNIEQITENQKSISSIATSYDQIMTKYNLLISDYSILYGNYSFPYNTNFTLLAEKLLTLVNNLKGNFSLLLETQTELNETYNQLLKAVEDILANGGMPTERFGELLNKCYDFINYLTIRELSTIISEATTLTVNICINYGNDTVEWYNNIKMPAGSSLFQATKKIASIHYNYYEWMEPGHIRVTEINGKRERTEPSYTEGWAWIWHYWDESIQDWVTGPVGCDAWMLKDGGTYKWEYTYWRWP